MKQTAIISSGFVALVLAVVAGILWYKNNYPNVNSFITCEKAGYPIMQGYPRTCEAGIKRFVEQSN